jgi:hypothetical protein
MSGSVEHPVGARRGWEGPVLGVVAVAAYAAFAAFTMFADGPASRNKAHAGVPVDAVRAATAASRDAAPAAVRAPRVNTADPVGNSNVRVRSPGGGPALAQVGNGEVAVGGGADTSLQFIVKFDAAEATRWRDRFVADPEGARAEWARFASQNPAFSGLRLERMTYSGLATLELEAAAPGSAEAVRQLSADIVRRLNAANGVDYAEPNLVGVREEAQ